MLKVKSYRHTNVAFSNSKKWFYIIPQIQIDIVDDRHMQQERSNLVDMEPWLKIVPTSKLMLAILGRLEPLALGTGRWRRRPGEYRPFSFYFLMGALYMAAYLQVSYTWWIIFVLLHSTENIFQCAKSLICSPCTDWLNLRLIFFLMFL